MSLLASTGEAVAPFPPPEWTGFSLEWVTGVGGTYDLNDNAFTSGPTPLVFTHDATSTALPAWLSVASNGIVTATSGATVGTTTGIRFKADDGVASPVASPDITVNISSPISTTVWPAQDAVGYVPAIRNRNGSGALFTAAGRGFGMDTRHAYSSWNVAAQTGTAPTIVHVTNNNATGTGSLRDALEVSSGPRVIVFDIGGDFQFDQTVRLEDGAVWIAGQSAPDLVNILTDANFFQVRDGNVFMEHVSVWNNGDLADWTVENIVRPRAMDTNDGSGNDWSKLVISHCFFGGATDQSLNLSARDQITIIDTMIALARGSTTYNHAYGGLWGESAANADSTTDVSSIGVVWAFHQRRTPFWRVEQGSLVNNLFYESANAAFEIEGNGNDGDLTMTLNVVGNRWLDQPADGEMFLYQDAIGETLATDSQLYLNDNLGPRYSSDEWDIVTDTSNQAADVRDNSLVTAAWPTGLVAADNRSQTEADFISLCTQNVGPRPGERTTFLQDVVDDIVGGTGAMADDYTAPTVASTTSTFVPVANPHEESGSSGRTNLEVQLLDLAEGLLV